MAYKLRSLISNKIVQAIEGFPIGGRGLKPSTILPCVQVDSKSGGEPEFGVSLKALHHLGIFTDHDDSTRSLAHVGSSLVEKLETDTTIPAAYLCQGKTDITLKFKVDYSLLASEVISITNNKPKSFWQCSALINLLPHERVVVEFSSPNIAKPFHVGHLRSTILGNFVAGLHAALGHTVTRINYLGDWGTQFGLLKYGYDSQNLTESDLKEDAVKKLYKVYVWANRQAESDPSVADTARQIFNKMERGDPEALSTWELFRRVSVEDLHGIYHRLNVYFDEYHGESMYGSEKCCEIVKAMEEKGLLEALPDGRKIYETKHGQKVTIVKSDGSMMYLSRDIAGAIERHDKYDFTKMYYVVENGQSDHFTHLFRILEQLGYDWVQGLKHIKFGRVQGMSSRKGTAVFLQNLLDEAQEVMMDKQEDTQTTKDSARVSMGKVAERVAVSSIIVGDLKQRRQRDYIFSWEKALQSRGDTGVKLQYVHCRLVSLERNCGFKYDSEMPLTPALLTQPPAARLIRELARFDEVLLETYSELEPCVLVAYLFTLCGSVNKALKQLPVKSAPREVGEARLAMFVAARHTLAAGLNILGVQPLEEM
ncbi:hypothetical protein Pmani_013976 [Petrolisthes manimaculis]|uniref:Probable arginine--tRNA ligase, mitochondrial n=1 Tax=Petrolisthes manimaculis TaxID=1843537 RepID=A0AAE1PTT5_9EUCA|nr:hypothetical protein Pmani_013976 [Petrolisthes manimaculis]